MGPAIPKTLDDIYSDYLQRREGLLLALTEGAAIPRPRAGLNRAAFWGSCIRVSAALNPGATWTKGILPRFRI